MNGMETLYYQFPEPLQFLYLCISMHIHLLKSMLYYQSHECVFPSVTIAWIHVQQQINYVHVQTVDNRLFLSPPTENLGTTLDLWLTFTQSGRALCTQGLPYILGDNQETSHVEMFCKKPCPNCLHKLLSQFDLQKEYHEECLWALSWYPSLFLAPPHQGNPPSQNKERTLEPQQEHLDI